MGTGTDAAVTLKYILAQVKHSLQCDDKYDEWILQEIINVVTDMNMFQVKLFGNKTIKCTITDINTIDFPIDYIDYVELYYKTLDGIKVPLSYEGRIAFPVSQVCGLQGNENTIADCEFPDAHNFGVGGGYNYCYYRPDKNNRRFVLRGTVPGGEVFLEYITTGVSTSETTFVPRAAVSAIVSGVIWHKVENDPLVAMNIKMRKSNLHAQYVRQLNAQVKSFNLDEMMDSIRRGYRQTVKQ